MTQTRQNVDTGARCRIAFPVTDAHIHIEEDFDFYLDYLTYFTLLTKGQ